MPPGRGLQALLDKWSAEFGVTIYEDKLAELVPTILGGTDRRSRFPENLVPRN